MSTFSDYIVKTAKKEQAASTAIGPMTVVAVEQHTPLAQRLVQDDLAYRFLPPGLRAVVSLTRWAPIRKLLFRASEKRATGIWGGVLCRKRYIDDQLVRSPGLRPPKPW